MYLYLNGDLCRDLYHKPYTALNSTLFQKPFRKPFEKPNPSSFPASQLFKCPALKGLVCLVLCGQTHPPGSRWVAHSTGKNSGLDCV